MGKDRKVKAFAGRNGMTYQAAFHACYSTKGTNNMTDCDVKDTTLLDVAAFAKAHLPAGSEAQITRGRSGRPHVLWLHVPGLLLDPDPADQDGPTPSPSRSFEFYDRLSVTRWLLAIVEDALIRLRVSFDDGEIPKDVYPRLRNLSDLAGRLMSERHRLEAHGGALTRFPLGNVISDEICRANGVTALGHGP
jgi:hypothetical protein